MTPPSRSRRGMRNYIARVQMTAHGQIRIVGRKASTLDRSLLEQGRQLVRIGHVDSMATRRFLNRRTKAGRHIALHGRWNDMVTPGNQEEVCPHFPSANGHLPGEGLLLSCQLSE